MRLVVFSKMFRQYDAEGLVALGRELGTEGWDLAVRKGHPVNPENVERMLPAAAKRLAEAGQPVLAVTGETDLSLLSRPAYSLFAILLLFASAFCYTK